MNLDLTEVERDVQESARRAVSSWMRNGTGAFAASSWKQVQELGWPSLPFAERAGGDDDSLVLLGLIAAEIGRAAMPCPFMQYVASAGVLIGRLASGPSAVSAADRSAAGKLNAVVVGAAVASKMPTLITDRGHQFLIGGPYAVEWAPEAEALLVPAATIDDSVVLLLVPREETGVLVSTEAGMDEEPLGLVRINGVLLEEEMVLTENPVPLDDWNEAIAVVKLLRLAEMIGGAERVLEMTVDYVKQRHQFARPIGSFQAVQHMCADMAMLVDATKLATYEGLWAASRQKSCARSAAVAQVGVSEACDRVVTTAAQLHGAIGHTQEHELSRYYRRAKVQQLRLGPTYTQLDEAAHWLLDGAESRHDWLWALGND